MDYKKFHFHSMIKQILPTKSNCECLISYCHLFRYLFIYIRMVHRILFYVIDCIPLISLLVQFSSVQFNSVISDSLWAHELQPARPPCPSPTPRVHSNSHPSSRWCHPAISSFDNPFSSCPQSLPASESFPMSQRLTWGGQSIGVSASTFPWTPRTDFLLDGLVGSSCSPRDSQESPPTPQFKTSILWHSTFFIVQLSYPYMTTGKNIALNRWIFVGKVMSLLLNMLSRLVITFLPRSKCLLISWLQSSSAVILEPQPKWSLSLF